jgi:hypothetical protein
MNEVSMCQGSRNRIEEIRYRPYVACISARSRGRKGEGGLGLVESEMRGRTARESAS